MSYSVREVAAMLGLKPAQIRSWASKGLLDPERGARGELRFGFRDLIVLRTAGELAAANIPQRKVVRALERLRDQLPAERALSGVRIAADGERIVVREGGSVWNPDSGQVLFDFTTDEVADAARPFEHRERAGGGESVDDLFDLACDLEVTSPEEARAAYQRVLEADPSHADAHVNLGRLLHEQRAPAAAEPHYRRALEIDPHHAVAAFNLGVALEDLGRLSEAVAAYERSLEIDPANADAHFNLAGILEKRGDKAGALRHLKACRSLGR